MKAIALSDIASLQAVVVDVRSPVVFKHGSLSGAINLSLEQIQTRQHQLPLDQPIVLVCERGIQSEVAGLYLEADGYTQVYNLKGGFRAYPPAW